MHHFKQGELGEFCLVSQAHPVAFIAFHCVLLVSGCTLKSLNGHTERMKKYILEFFFLCYGDDL